MYKVQISENVVKLAISAVELAKNFMQDTGESKRYIGGKNTSVGFLMKQGHRGWNNYYPSSFVESSSWKEFQNLIQPLVSILSTHMEEYCPQTCKIINQFMPDGHCPFHYWHSVSITENVKDVKEHVDALNYSGALTVSVTLKGNGVLTVNGQEIQLTPGQAIFFDGKKPHSVVASHRLALIFYLHASVLYTAISDLW